MVPAGRLGSLVLAHLFLILAVSPVKGAEDVSLVVLQTSLELVSFVALVRAVGVRSETVDGGAPGFMAWVLVVSGVSFVIFGSTLYGANRAILLPVRFVCLPLLTIFVLPEEAPPGSVLRPLYRWRSRVFWMLCLLAVVLRVMALRVSPEPTIDVFWFTNQGAEGLWHGINPYDRTYHMIDPRSVGLYAYLPGQFLVDVPSRLLFGDMRWGQVVVELLSAALLYRIVGGRGASSARRRASEILVLLYLFFPHALRVQEQAWVEYKQVLALVLFVWLSVRPAGGAWAFVALGWLFALKQTTWAAVPFVGKIPGVSLRKLGIAAAVSAVFVVPFLVWNPAAFLEDIVLYHLALPLPHSPSLAWAAQRLTGHPIPVGWVAAGALAVLLYGLRRGERSLSGFLTASSMLGMFLVLARQAYLNYFYYIDGTILAAMAVELRSQYDRLDGTGNGSRLPV